MRTGNLHGKPAIIVHGRSDTLFPLKLSLAPISAGIASPKAPRAD
jgi:hypothetical protein